MSVTIDIILNSAAPQGLGGGIVPFGFYEVIVKKSETKVIEKGANAGMYGTTMWCEIRSGTDPEQVGKEIRPYVVWPNPAFIDPVADEGKLNAMTARCKSWLVATAADQDQREKAKAFAGTLSGFAPDARCANKVLRVMWDPANPRLRDTEQEEHDDARYLDDGQYAKAMAGTLAFTRRNTYDPEARGAVTVPPASKASARDAAPASNWTPPTSATTTPTAPVQQPAPVQQAQPAQVQPAPAPPPQPAPQPAAGGGLL